jgi:hypothetical protein
MPLFLKSDKMDTKATGYWNIKKEKLKQKYKNLSDKDLSFTEGREKEMIEMLSQKLGKTKQELLKIIVAL